MYKLFNPAYYNEYDYSWHLSQQIQWKHNQMIMVSIIISGVRWLKVLQM